MIRKSYKRVISLILAVALCISAFSGLGTVVFAAGAEEADVCIVEYPRGADTNRSNWGHGKMSFMNGWGMEEASTVALRAMNSYTGKICYCIEPGTGQYSGDTFTKKDESFFDNFPSEYNKTISGDDIKLFIGRIMQYGYTGNISTEWCSQNSDGADKLAHAFATQYLIWETVVGERNEEFEHVSIGNHNAILDLISKNSPIYSRVMTHYNRIEASVKNHSKVPSFCKKATNKAETVELKWNGSEYTAVLTDTNNVLANYKFTSSASGVSFSVSGNKLTISSKTAPADAATITAEKKESLRKGLIIWTDGKYEPGVGKQDTVTYAQEVNDPVKAYLKVNVSYGNAKIVKTSEDGKVDGISFTITGNGINKTVKTDSKGEIKIGNLTPGIYTVTEQEYDKYEPQESRRVTVVSGQTATVTFNNKLKRGELTVIKKSDDNFNEGVKFHLYGTSLSGLTVDEYAVTDSNGVAKFKGVLIGSGYNLEEIDTTIRYVVPDKQTANIEWNKVTEKSFHNVLKKFRVTVTKSDKETGTAQGDASLAGAKYGIYKGEQLVDTYTTDNNGQFTTKYYICGNDWTIREVSPSEGYQLDKTVYHIGAEAKLYTVERNSTANDVLETVNKGKIALIKHCDDGSTQIETPEVGAEFEVYLKSAGSYDGAKNSEKDYLVCDENGFAETKLLPYGVYTVKQTKGWDGKELMPAFDVFVSENGQTYRYLINNATFESLIEIVKKDIETEKIIPAAGIGFKVRNTDTGEYVIQHINYPTPMDIDTYYTDSTGKLMMPEKLPFGNYEVIEMQTCHGYVLDSKPVPFKVDGTQTVVTVEKHNIAQKGKITVSKSGEVFSSVTESDGIYQPVYSINGLAGAVYEIYADEDIITLDGTVRAKKGDLVATVKTDKNSVGTSGLLYLGKYKIVEKKAPYGMVINSEPQIVELVYAGQEIKVTSASTAFYNERQRVKIDLNKILEQDEKYGIGMNGEILSVSFGLYVAEDITAADGTVIPKDGLIEIVSCDENGKAVFNTDIPVGAKLYVKEYSTDEHYIIDNTTYPVEFNYEGQDTAVVHISVNDGKDINNEIIRGSVIGKKIDEDGFTICGAVFGLFLAAETEFTEDTALMISKSNEIGVFGFENVPFGNWVVREIAPAPAFVLNDIVYPVTISKNEEIVEIEVENRFIVGAVQTTKVDAEYPENKLSGAVFEIYVDVDHNKEFNADIDKLIGEMTETENGVYRMDKLRYDGYFLYEKSAPEGFIKDDNYHYFEIRNDGETIIVENEAGVGFVNKPIVGELEITKKDISDGTLLPNAGFRIKNENGDIVAEGHTDENGIARFTLRYGKYTYEEYEAPEGYLIDTTPHDFEITEDGQIIKAEMTNEKIPTPDAPQTGDNSSIGFFIGLGAIALGGLISCAIVYIKKKKDDDDE